MMNHNPPSWNYEIAPRDFSLEQARRMLALLHGHGLEEFGYAGRGDCDDCGTSAELLAYDGDLRLCRPCAGRRSRARVAPTSNRSEVPR
jgi:hypothetical protein